MQWIRGVLIMGVLGALAGCFFVRDKERRLVGLISGILVTLAIVVPVGQRVKNSAQYWEQLFINPVFDHTIKTETPQLYQDLVIDGATQALRQSVQDELVRRLGRQDFSVELTQQGKAILFCEGPEFPKELAGQILSALLGGAQICVKGEGRGEAMVGSW